MGYEPLLADAHDLPLSSAVWDIVILNATIHHCEHMQPCSACWERLHAFRSRWSPSPTWPNSTSPSRT